MQAYICTICNYLYDDQSAQRSPEGRLIPFEDLDEEWRCPNCGVRPNEFKPIDSDRVPDVPTSKK